MRTQISSRWQRTLALMVALALVLGLRSAVLAQTAPSASPALVAVVTDPEGLNLRAGPGTDFPSLALLPEGTELQVRGAREHSTWLPVLYRDLPGFVHTDYIELRPVRTPAATPSTRPTPSPSPSPAPAPTPPPPPLSPAASLSDSGVTLAGVFALDADGMITIGDAFELIAVVRPPAGVTAATLRLSGAPFLSTTAAFALEPGDNWLRVPAFRVDTENEPSLREAVIRTVGGTIPIRGGALVLAVDVQEHGAERTVVFEPTVYDYANPSQLATVEYPDLTRITGVPPGLTSREHFYLRGDADFHHPDDFYVRKLAVEAGRRGGVFPDDPELVADNVFTYINALLGDAEPGDFNNDYNMARLIDEGTIRRGQSNGGYICIAQTYLMTALTRTLGIPSRELNLAVGKPNFLGTDGVWRVTWFQEAALHTWYNGQWNLYDLWLGFKGENGYFTANLAYQMWAAFDQRAVPFMTINGLSTGLRGRDFNAYPGDPPQFTFVQEATKPGVLVLGMPDEQGEPITRVPDADTYLKTDRQNPPRGPAIQTAQPPVSSGILTPPQTRP